MNRPSQQGPATTVMAPHDFVARQKANWDRLDGLVRRIEAQGLRSLNHNELYLLGSLYRRATTDLAYAQTYYPASQLSAFLNQVVARAHNHVYRVRRHPWRRISDYFVKTFPQTFRKHLGTFNVTLLIMVTIGLIAYLMTWRDEKYAMWVLSPSLIDHIHRGEMWTEGSWHGPMMTVALYANNATVAFWAFTGGVLFGLGTFYILAKNAMMMGVIIAMIDKYDMEGPFYNFVTPHGILEIWTIVIACTAGFLIGTALIDPGPHPRVDALKKRGREAGTLVLGCIFLLAIAALIEGNISPSDSIGLAGKLIIGFSVGLTFLCYLLFTGHDKRRTAREEKERSVRSPAGLPRHVRGEQS